MEVKQMKVSYFPGCTLRTKAKKLDFYARRCAEILGAELCEIENWQCCGGVFVSAGDEIATKLSSVRALKEARDNSRPLVTVCSACHNVIKQTNHQIRTDADFTARVNNYMAQDKDFESPYEGEAEVCHYLELLRDKIGFDKVREAVKNPLTGRKIAAYYGCLLLRPGKVMALDDPENPRIMEDFIRALGAEPVIYPFGYDCYRLSALQIQSRKERKPCTRGIFHGTFGRGSRSEGGRRCRVKRNVSKNRFCVQAELIP